MKTLNQFLVAFAIIMSTANASAASSPEDTTSLSCEIAQIVQDHCSFQEEVTVTVFFSVSEDNKVQNLSVVSGNSDIDEFVLDSFSNRELAGEYWKKGKIYEVAITPEIE